MCNRYHPARPDEMAYFRAAFGLDEPPRGHVGDPIFRRDIGPFGQGTFVRASCDHSMEVVVGQWGLIGWFAKAPIPPKKPGQRPILTNNARMETVHQLPTYKGPWAKGQRCVIPAWSYVEPNWESGKNEWWRFRRRDGEPWGMAGLWNTWVNSATGEVHESYTMVTLNCDHHPLLNRMHRPDAARPPTMQDKRAVVPLHSSSLDVWLHGTIEQARAALQLPHVDDYDASPDTVAPPKPTSPPEQGQLL